MKTRTGFVSNSSSSSFIVRFNQDPTDMDNLREMMGDCSVDPYGTAISTEKVLETVMADIVSQKAGDNTILPFEQDDWDLQRDAEQLLHDAGFYYDDVNGKLWDDAVTEMEQEITKFKLAMYYKTKNTTPEEEAKRNEFVCRFSYADEDGNFWAAMEHGGVFRNVDHDMTSNH